MNNPRVPKKGLYYPKNREKYLGDHIPIYRSSWEQRMMYYIDNNPNILKWGNEMVAVPYLSPKDGKIHRYFVDFYIEVLDKRGDIKKLLIEVKPKKKLLPPKTLHRSKKTVVTETIEYYVNMAKFQSAKAFAEKNGMEWHLYTEDDIEMHC